MPLCQVANVYASMRLRYLQTGSLRGMAVSLPLCLLLTLLQDDGAFLYGLDEKSRYAPPLFAFLLRLLSSALHAVVMPGNPFFGGDPVTLQKAYAAAQTSPQVRNFPSHRPLFDPLSPARLSWS